MSEPVNLFEIAERAAQKIAKAPYGYYASGANDEITLELNRRDFDKIQLRPRMLRDVSQRDLSTQVLGKKHALPIMIAPTALAKMAHPDGELGVVRAAGEFGISAMLSTASSYPLEDVAANATAPLWFQLYVYKDRAVTRSLVQRAEVAGYEALVLTVDTPLMGRREADVRNNFTLPDGITFANFAGDTLKVLPTTPEDSGFNAYIMSLWDTSLTWADVEWLDGITSMPILVKGILRADDAQLAVEHGAQGIVVSNHGGRQLDTAISTIRALPEIVDAVDGKIDIILDGGVRRGTDILKALAIGANTVAMGRPVLWGLGYDGQAGVSKTLSLLKTEFDLAMALSGCRSVAELTPDLVVLP